MHIPKTGGSTFMNIIFEKYSGHQIFNPINYYFTKSNIPISKEIKFIHGHTAFGNFPEDKSIENIYVTLLREPIERVISQYYFAVQIKHFDPNKVSLKQFILSKDYYSFTNNIQTRYAAGKQVCNASTLNLAKQNLIKHFRVVGITDMFDETLSWMSYQFGWNISSYEKKNITEQRPKIQEIPNYLLEEIKRLNNLDIQLYNFAKNNLKKNLSSF